METLTKINLYEDRIQIKGPYCDTVAAWCRARGGKWRKIFGCWELSIARLAEVVAYFGEFRGELVLADVAKKDLNSDAGQEYCIGGHIIARRDGRDKPAKVWADLVAGTVPEKGGSVKNPLVRASDDAVFRMVLPRDLADRRGLSYSTNGGESWDPAAYVAEPSGAAVPDPPGVVVDRKLSPATEGQRETLRGLLRQAAEHLTTLSGIVANAECGPEPVGDIEAAEDLVSWLETALTAAHDIGTEAGSDYDVAPEYFRQPTEQG